MKARIGVVVMAALLVLYLVLVGQRAVVLIGAGEAVGVAMGVSLLVLPVIAGWAIGRELWFGVGAERLGRRLEAEGALPDEVVATHPSGRIDRSEGEAVFPRYRDAVAAAPEDWRAWYRLALAYDAAGDRRRARHAVRQAIRFERAAR
ncbi:tetratricopeptide repeat protein [Microbacterium limosum]|uniref:Tetratricopeptide repeat protein n=1 Tax=Microbacterium limosum TaxID=3079935 RepID=A0AAU0MEF7_9MICO|nr:tetratricopeptide repeat protein [Microbacterium sp. Y20]WOQ68638.1 tetratricopeptide repeat protein [Microbacterium sp. Y20]